MKYALLKLDDPELEAIMYPFWHSKYSAKTQQELFDQERKKFEVEYHSTLVVCKIAFLREHEKCRYFSNEFGVSDVIDLLEIYDQMPSFYEHEVYKYRDPNGTQHHDAAERKLDVFDLYLLEARQHYQVWLKEVLHAYVLSPGEIPPHSINEFAESSLAHFEGGWEVTQSLRIH